MARSAAVEEPRPAFSPIGRLLRVPPWAAGLICLACLAVALSAAFPARSPLVTPHGTGDRTWSWLYFGAAIAAFAAYVGGLLLLERGRTCRLAAVVAVAAAIQLLPLGAPVVLSTDVYTYWDYGRLSAVHGANPYSVEPRAFPDDPAFSRMGSAWHGTTTVYMPGFTLASEGAAAAAGDSARATAWIYKVAAALSMLALVGLAARLGSRPAFSAAFVGWNPLLAVHFAGGGHNDAAMMALVLAGLALAASGRRWLAGAAWAASVGVKWVPLAFLPLRLLADRASGKPVRPFALGFLTAAAAGAALGFWRYGLAWATQTFGPVADNMREQSHYAIPYRLHQLTSIPGGAAAVILAVLFCLAYVWLVREALRGRARLGLAAGFLVVATSWIVPWYAVWAVPLAAAEDDRAAQWLALALSAYLLRQAVPL